MRRGSEDDGALSRRTEDNGALSRWTSKRAKLYARIEKFIGKMEARADKFEEKVSRKLGTKGGALSAVGYKKVWIIATVACLAAIPIVGGALSLATYTFQVRTSEERWHSLTVLLCFS